MLYKCFVFAEKTPQTKEHNLAVTAIHVPLSIIQESRFPGIVLEMWLHPGHTCVVSLAMYPANMTRWPNVGLLLGQRRWRLPSSKPTLSQRLMFGV